MNALVDPAAIEALYAASRAGVRIDLIVRGICCLRPGVPNISENIRVISIVDKFLEHSRIAFFQNGDSPEVFLASADWMPRNFRRRVEIMFPIEDPRLQNRIVEGMLGVVLMDNVKARVLQPDGTYRRVPPARPGEPDVRSQVEFQNMARELSSSDPIRPATHAGSPVGVLRSPES
jgi:polyphosphate kinase